MNYEYFNTKYELEYTLDNKCIFTNLKKYTVYNYNSLGVLKNIFYMKNDFTDFTTRTSLDTLYFNLLYYAEPIAYNSNKNQLVVRSVADLYGETNTVTFINSYLALQSESL